MKKLFYLLLLPLTLLVACNDDKDFSPVDMTLTLSGVTQDNDTFYTVAGDDVTIENLTVKSIDGKNTAVQNVIFYLDGIPLIGNPADPFMGTFSTEGLEAGTHKIGVEGNLLQVDSSIMTFAVTFNLNIVESQDDLPANAPEIGSYSQSVRLNNN